MIWSRCLGRRKAKNGGNFCHIWMFSSMDWLKGKFTGKPHNPWENLWFPVDFPLNQSIVSNSIPLKSARGIRFTHGLVSHHASSHRQIKFLPSLSLPSARGKFHPRGFVSLRKTNTHTDTLILIILWTEYLVRQHYIQHEESHPRYIFPIFHSHISTFPQPRWSWPAATKRRGLWLQSPCSGWIIWWRALSWSPLECWVMLGPWGLIQATVHGESWWWWSWMWLLADICTLKFCL